MKCFLGIILLIMWIFCLGDEPGKKFDELVDKVYDANNALGNLATFGVSAVMGLIFCVGVWMLF